MSNPDKLSPLSRELLDRADVIFNKISQSAGAVGNVAAEQLPSIANEFILFNRVYYTSIFLVCIAIIATVVILVIKLERKVHHHYTALPSVIGGGICIVPLITAISITKSLIMVWFAPKIFLLTEIVNLTKDIVK